MLLGLCAASVLFLRTRFARDQACTLVRTRLPAALGMDVRIGRCELDPLAQTVTLRDLAILPHGATEPTLSADWVEVSVTGMEFWSGRLALGKLNIQRAHLRLDFSGEQSPSALPAKGVLSTSRSACPLDALKKVSLDSLKIEGAELSVKLSQGGQLELSGLNLRWATRRDVAEYHLETSAGSVKLGRGGKDFAVAELRAEGSFKMQDLELRVTRGELTLDDLNLAFSGKADHLCHPVVNADGQLYLPLKTAAKALASPLPMDGHLLGHVTVSGSLPEPLVFAELAGQNLQVGKFRPGDFSARLAYAAQVVTVQDLSFSAGPGKVRAAGTVKLTSGFPLKGAVELKQASFAQILARAGIAGSWVDWLSTGRISLQGHLSPAVALNGELELKTERFRLTPHAHDEPARGRAPLLTYEAGSARLSFHIAKDRAELLQARLTSAHSAVTGGATLFFKGEEGLSLKVSVEALDLQDFSALAGIPWRGRGTATLQLEGPYTRPRISAGIDLNGLEFANLALGAAQGPLQYRDGQLRLPVVAGQKGRTRYTGQVALDFTGPSVLTRVQADFKQGRIEDVVDLTAKLAPGFASNFQGGALVGGAAGSVRLEIAGNELEGLAAVALENLAYRGRRLGAGSLRLHFTRSGSVILEKTTLRGPLGVSSLEGSYDSRGALDALFRVDALSLPELLGSRTPLSSQVAGVMTLVGKIGGTADFPEVSGYLTSPELLVGRRGFGALRLEGRLEGKELDVFGTTFGDTHAAAHLTLSGSFPYHATMKLSLPEIRPFLPAGAVAQGLSGTLDGDLSVQGELLKPASLRASAKIGRVQLFRGDYAGRNVAPFSVQYAQGKLALQEFVFAAPNTQLTLSGWAGPEALDLTMHGSLDMRLLESLLPGLERTGGTVDLTAEATGRVDNPSLVGGAQLHDVHFSLRNQPVEVRSLTGRVEFSAARVLLEDVQGILNDGRLALHGDLVLSHFQVARMEVGAQLDEVSWRLGEDVPLTASGELFLQGKPTALTLTGDLDIQKLRYDRPLVLETMLTDLLKSRSHRSYAGTSQERPVEWLLLDVGVHLKDARVDNNVARAKIVGNLKVTGSNVRPGLVGTVETGEGSQAYYRGNQFVLTQGQVELKNKNGLDGLFDVHAQTQAREYLVRLHAFGRLSKPQVLLSAEPQLSEADILSLLTLGVTSRDKGNTTRTGTGLAAEVFLNYSGLDRQVQKFLPKNPVLRDLSFHISTTYNDANGLVEPTAQLESKFLVDQLKLRMSQPVSGRGTRAQAEYRFDDRLSAQGQWDNEQSNYTFGNLGLDLKLRWDVD